MRFFVFILDGIIEALTWSLKAIIFLYIFINRLLNSHLLNGPIVYLMSAHIALITLSHTHIMHAWMRTSHGFKVSFEDVCWFYFSSHCSLVSILGRGKECVHAVLLDHRAPVNRETYLTTNVTFFIFHGYIGIAVTEDACLFAKVKVLRA